MDQPRSEATRMRGLAPRATFESAIGPPTWPLSAAMPSSSIALRSKARSRGRRARASTRLTAPGRSSPLPPSSRSRGKANISPLSSKFDFSAVGAIPLSVFNEARDPGSRADMPLLAAAGQAACLFAVRDTKASGCAEEPVAVTGEPRFGFYRSRCLCARSSGLLSIPDPGSESPVGCSWSRSRSSSSA